jgi:hypothetical protein
LTRGAGDVSNVGFVRGHNDISSSTEGAFDHGDIDYVVVVSSSGELTDAACLVGAHRLDFAPSKHARQARLTAPTPPRFGDNRRWYYRYDLLGDEPDVQCPHPPIVAFPGN